MNETIPTMNRSCNQLNASFVNTTGVKMSPDILNFSANTNLSHLAQNATMHTTSHSNYIFLLAPIMFGAFFGNALVILAFRKGPRTIRTLTNYFVVNLAVSDMLIGCVSLPIWIAINLEFSPDTNKKMGDYHTSIDVFLSVISINSLVVISLERLYAIRYPASHRYLKKKTVMITIACIWGLAVLLTIAVSVLTIYDLKFHTGWITLLVTVTFALPLIIITASYIILFTTASQLMKADNQPTSVTREIRIAKTIFVIVSLFVVCWTPFFVLNLLFSYNAVTEKSRYLQEAIQITKALHYSNSIMNVFVYAVRSPDFKETFVKILTVRVRKVRERAYTIMSIRDRNDCVSRAHLGPVKIDSLTGSVTVVLQLDDNDIDYNENMRFGIGIGARFGTHCTEISHLSDESLVPNDLGNDNEQAMNAVV